MDAQGISLAARAVAGAVAVVLATGAARAGGAAPRPALVSPRVCSITLLDVLTNLCDENEGGRTLSTEGVVCTVYVRRPTQTPMTMRIRYAGIVQRSWSGIVRKSGGRALRLEFPDLGDSSFPPGQPSGLPRGAYACEFVLGRERLTVPFRTDGPTDPLLVPNACRPTGGASPAGYYCDGGGGRVPRGHSVACKAVFARLTGRRVQIEIHQGRGAGAALLYSASRVIRRPIEEVWAYTSAPRGAFLSVGPYECGFRLGEGAVATVPFTIER